MGLIALLASTLRVLLSTLRMLNAPCVIALAMLLSGSAVRLCSIFVKFGSSIVIVICHFCFLWVRSQRVPGKALRLVRS